MAFNSLHTALEAAVNTLLASGLCAEINLVMSPSYTLEEGIINGADYRVECLKPASVDPVKILITFTPPTEREDGSVLKPEEIKGYELEFYDGCVTGKTVDIDGLKSDPVISCYQGD